MSNDLIRVLCVIVIAVCAIVWFVVPMLVARRDERLALEADRARTAERREMDRRQQESSNGTLI